MPYYESMTTNMNSNPKPTLARRALRAVFNLVAMAASFMVVLVGITMLQDAIGGPAAPVATVATVPDVMFDARTLMVENDCWSGEAPADLAGVPTGVVYMDEDDQQVTLGGQKAVSLALGQLFADEDHGLVVFGFCR